MDIRFLIVGAPFIISFFYALFWLKKWGAFNSSTNFYQKQMISRNNKLKTSFNLQNIFLMKN